MFPTRPHPPSIIFSHPPILAPPLQPVCISPQNVTETNNQGEVSSKNITIEMKLGEIASFGNAMRDHADKFNNQIKG